MKWKRLGKVNAGLRLDLRQFASALKNKECVIYQTFDSEVTDLIYERPVFKVKL